MDFYLGIDLGTTNSSVSIARDGSLGTIEVETLRIPQIAEDGITFTEKQLLPSVLYREGSEVHVGEYAKAIKKQSSTKTISNSKNYMGEEVKLKTNGVEYLPEEVAACILKHIKENISYGKVTSAVITVPASFDMDQKNATRRAAVLAGFDESEIILISEPTAAILDFINEQRKYTDNAKLIDFSKGKNVLVFDLGGGTCDVAILSVKMTGDKVDVKEVAVSEHTLVGGTNFDMYAVKGVIDSYNKKNGINLEKELSVEQYEDLEYALSIRCEEAKMFFSGRYHQCKDTIDYEKRVESVRNYPISIPNIIDGMPFKYDFKMKDYNKFISPLLRENDKGVKNIIRPILDTIKASKLSMEEIDCVFCAGGMTVYPAVGEVLKNLFGKEPLSSLDKMLSISRGAAVYHKYRVNHNEIKKHSKNSNMDILPTMPQSVFLNVADDLPICLIEKGTRAGEPIIQENIIKVNSETSVELELYAGRSLYDPHLKKLHNAVLKFPMGIQRGAGITLKLEYTDKGVLNFEAWLTDNREIKLEVALDKSSLSKSELTQKRKEIGLINIKEVF